MQAKLRMNANGQVRNVSEREIQFDRHVQG